MLGMGGLERAEVGRGGGLARWGQTQCTPGQDRTGDLQRVRLTS